MKRCAHCRSRFGLIRYTAYRAFIQFCRKKCERAYFDERLSLTKHFVRIKNPKLRRSIVDLVEHIAARHN